MEQPASTASSDGDSGCALDEYTWIPPGLTAQQVSAYMHVKLTYTEIDIDIVMQFYAWHFWYMVASHSTCETFAHLL